MIAAVLTLWDCGDLDFGRNMCHPGTMGESDYTEGISNLTGAGAVADGPARSVSGTPDRDARGRTPYLAVGPGEVIIDITPGVQGSHPTTVLSDSPKHSRVT